MTLNRFRNLVSTFVLTFALGSAFAPRPEAQEATLVMGSSSGTGQLVNVTNGSLWVTLTGGTASATTFLAGEGSQAAPSYSFTSFPTSGLFDIAGVPQMSVGGTNSYVFGAATFQTNTAIQTNGNVTIPNTSGLVWSSRGLHRANADGVHEFTDSATTRKFDITAHTTPTCPANCGTSPTITGVDSAFTVTMGATGTPASPWAISFGTTWAAAPQCAVFMAKTGMASTKVPMIVATSTTQMTVTNTSAAPSTTDVYNAVCFLGQ